MWVLPDKVGMWLSWVPSNRTTWSVETSVQEKVEGCSQMPRGWRDFERPRVLLPLGPRDLEKEGPTSAYEKFSLKVSGNHLPTFPLYLLRKARLKHLPGIEHNAFSQGTKSLILPGHKPGSV